MFRSKSTKKHAQKEQEQALDDFDLVKAPSSSSYPGDKAMEPDVGKTTFADVDWHAETYKFDADRMHLMNAEELVHLHALCVANLEYHIVPPYVIRGPMPPNGNLCTDTFHPFSEKGKVISRMDTRFYVDIGFGPGYKFSRRQYKVVHWKGQVSQVPKCYHGRDCDETCPDYKNKPVQRAAIKALRKGKELKKEYIDDFDYRTLL